MKPLQQYTLIFNNLETYAQIYKDIKKYAILFKCLKVCLPEYANVSKSMKT